LKGVDSDYTEARPLLWPAESYWSRGGVYANSSFSPISTNTAEIYSPVIGTFASTGKMTASRRGHTATLLTNRRVLVAGGQWTEQAPATALDTAELYDEDTGVFTLTGAMPEPRFNHTATVLKDGRVLLAGGFTYPAASWVARAALYDPVTGTFSPTDVMVTPRVGHKATLLPDGKVLLTGGQARPHRRPCTYSSRAQRFTRSRNGHVLPRGLDAADASLAYPDPARRRVGADHGWG
jgi:hypothetical protein